jgi:hypothetical protein
MKGRLSKENIKRRPNFKKKKESVTIAAKRIISLKNADRLRLTMRKPIILKRNENEGLKKNFN